MPPPPGAHADKDGSFVRRHARVIASRLRFPGKWQFWLWVRWVRDSRPVDTREWRECVQLTLRAAHDVFDGDFAGDERVGNQRAMAAPGNRFRAHDGATLPSRELDEFRERRIEFRSLHVIRVSTKAIVPPSRIDGTFFRVTQAAELFSVNVSNMSLTQRILERIGIELRITPRTRDRSDINNALHAVRVEQSEELIERPGGVADRQNHIVDGWRFGLTRNFGLHASFLHRSARFCRSARPFQPGLHLMFICGT
jgi:hypothetical protein